MRHDHAHQVQDRVVQAWVNSVQQAREKRSIESGIDESILEHNQHQIEQFKDPIPRTPWIERLFCCNSYKAKKAQQTDDDHSLITASPAAVNHRGLSGDDDTATQDEYYYDDEDDDDDDERATTSSSDNNNEGHQQRRQISVSSDSTSNSGAKSNRHHHHTGSPATRGIANSYMSAVNPEVIKIPEISSWVKDFKVDDAYAREFRTPSSKPAPPPAYAPKPNEPLRKQDSSSTLLSGRPGGFRTVVAPNSQQKAQTLTDRNGQLRNNNYRRNSVEELMREITSLSSLGPELYDSNDSSFSIRGEDGRRFSAAALVTSFDEELVSSERTNPQEIKERVNRVYRFKSPGPPVVNNLVVAISHLTDISARSTLSNGADEEVPTKVPTGLNSLAASRLRFSKKVICEAIVVGKRNQDSMAIMTNFCVTLNPESGDLTLTRGSQEKVFLFEHLVKIDASQTCLETAKNSTLGITDWSAIPIDLLQLTGRVAVVYYTERVIPVIVIFDYANDLKDFIELISLTISDNRRNVDLLQPQPTKRLSR